MHRTGRQESCPHRQTRISVLPKRRHRSMATCGHDASSRWHFAELEFPVRPASGVNAGFPGVLPPFRSAGRLACSMQLNRCDDRASHPSRPALAAARHRVSPARVDLSRRSGNRASRDCAAPATTRSTGARVSGTASGLAALRGGLGAAAPRVTRNRPSRLATSVRRCGSDFARLLSRPVSAERISHPGLSQTASRWR